MCDFLMGQKQYMMEEIYEGNQVNKFEMSDDTPTLKQEEDSQNVFQEDDEEMLKIEESLDQLQNKGYFKMSSTHSQTKALKSLKSQPSIFTQAPSHYPRKRTVVTLDLLQQAKLLFQRKQQQKDLTLIQIGKMLDLGYSTISNLYTEWKGDPYFLSKSANILQRDMNSQVCTVKRIQFLVDILTENPFLTQEQIIDKVNNNPQLVKNGKEVTRFTIHNTLKKLNYVKKLTSLLPKSDDSPQALFHRKFIRNSIKPFWQSTGKVFFLKIERLNIYTVRGRGWAVGSQKVNMNAPCTKSNNLIILLMTNKDGMLRVQIFTQEITKKQILKATILMLKESALINNPSSVMLVSERFLLGKEVQQILEKIQLKSIKTPDYLLELNPLDSFMREVRGKLRRVHFRHHQEMRIALEEVLNSSGSRTMLCKYMDYMRVYLEAQNI